MARTINSIASSNYPCEKQLFFIVADGMVVGAGNKYPTPHLLLDLLGKQFDEEASKWIYDSVCDDDYKVVNFAQVYSGYYKLGERSIPYVVIVKFGCPGETEKPGNRGKRDSQIILMRFLSRVYYKDPMCPLEWEIHHQMTVELGLDPTAFEYLLMVDADTEVHSDSLNHLVASCVQDSKIIGICGETQVSNEHSSWVSMIQVYEYYISHHHTKAFESLFGFVTCLPGCFSLYRLKLFKAAGGDEAILISRNVIDDFSQSPLDTLHKRNLLALGEDRYLTTLVLKHFPRCRTKFTPEASCKTIAPDTWKVLLSQRRRWINSTIHNLFELILHPHMCGLCCLSMRLIVLTDLYSTMVMPASITYLGYLVFGALNARVVPTISLALLAAVYGMQIMVFLLKRQWQYIGWLLLHLISLPLFGFVIPLYAFWHFDDFSWGNTRLLAGSRKDPWSAKPFYEREETIIPLIQWDRPPDVVADLDTWSCKSQSGESDE